MLAFTLRRILQSLAVMLTVGLIAFALFRYVGDPINNMVGQDTTLEQRAELREGLGLNDPFLVQYGRYLWQAAHGDFGISYRHRRPVRELLIERLPATLELSLVAALMALLIGVPMGVYTALHRKGFWAHAFMTLSLIGISLPTFLIGILLILVFGVILQWPPTLMMVVGCGRMSFSWIAAWKARATWSEVPPALNGTMILTGFSGHSARARFCSPKASVTTASMVSMRRIILSS